MAAPLTQETITALRANDKDDRRRPFIVGNSVLIFLTFVSVILRFWSRRIIKTYWGADDWTIVVGMLITVLYAAILLVMTTHGMGRHIWWLENPRDFAKLALAAECVYNAAIPIIKSSILLLYRRIFLLQWFNRFLLYLGLFIVAYSTAQFVADIFQCIPVNSVWGDSPKKHCINYPALIKVGGIINILTDVVILALPLPSLWQLTLSTARKRLLIGLFLMGGLACIASIVRLFFVDKIGNSNDPTWDYTFPALIGNTELSIGVAAANFITYRPLVNKLRSSNLEADTSSIPGGPVPSGPIRDSLQKPLSSLFKQGDTCYKLDEEANWIRKKRSPEF